MPSRLHRPPKGIPHCLIESCIPVEWRPNIKRTLDIQDKRERPSYYSRAVFTGLRDKTEKFMVCHMLTNLKDFANQGHISKAVEIFSLVRGHALASGSSDFVVDALSSLLFSCTNLKLLPEGKQIHAQAITSGFQWNYALVRKLVSFYTAFDLLDDAHIIIAGSNVRHPFPWNVLISSYVSKGFFQEAILAYKQMCCMGTKPDNFTYPSVLKACAEQSDLVFGREVHKSINTCCLDWNLFVQNALISMYGKCGDLGAARCIFNEMPVKDEVSWNSMISVYASIGTSVELFELFENMCAAGTEFNTVTWNTVVGVCLRKGDFRRALEVICQMRVNRLDPVAVINGLKACSHLCAVKPGKELHALAFRNSSIDYPNVKHALIAFYARCRHLSHAYMVFRLIKAKTIVAWNSIISGFSLWDLAEDATILLRELLLTGLKPNYVTLASILPLSARVANLRQGKELHCYIIRHEELEGHLKLMNALIDVYAKSGRVSTARKLFDSLDNRDAVTYTSMIAGYGVHGDGKVAVALFEQMLKSNIKPDDVAMVAILSACSHSGLVGEGQFYFETMQSIHDIAPNLEHYACMADLYGRAGLLKKAKDIILRMPCKPTTEIWATLIGACRIHGNTELGGWAADRLLDMKSESSGHYILIANMYAAAGYWGKHAAVRMLMRDSGVGKDPGCAWVDFGAGLSPFLVEDTSHSQADEISVLLLILSKHMKDINHGACEHSKRECEALFDYFNAI